MARVFEGQFIGGRSSTRRMFKDLNPADGSVWAEVPDCGRAETAAAIEAAHAAFAEWSALPFTKRAHYLEKAAEILEKRRMEIVEALQAEGGGWFGKGMFETGYTVEVFRAAAASVWQSTGEVMPSEYGKLSMAVRRPMGVVSIISPWNFPCILSARGFAFPLAAGNTIVLKPSEETPYCGGLLFAEVFEEAGLPEGRVQCRDLLARQCAGGRRRTDRASVCEGHLLHRLDRGRPADRGQGRRASEEVLRRTRRQGLADRLRGRRHGARHPGREFRLVHASGPDLHVGREGAGAREDFRPLPQALHRTRQARSRSAIRPRTRSTSSAR